MIPGLFINFVVSRSCCVIARCSGDTSGCCGDTVRCCDDTAGCCRWLRLIGPACSARSALIGDVAMPVHHTCIIFNQQIVNAAPHAIIPHNHKHNAIITRNRNAIGLGCLSTASRPFCLPGFAAVVVVEIDGATQEAGQVSARAATQWVQGVWRK